jgi:signal transduction histidine kinase
MTGNAQYGIKSPLTSDDRINRKLGMDVVHVFPLMLRDNPVGVLLVDATNGREDTAKFHSLEAITNQAAVSLGATMMCINRAQRLAVQEERLRIAQDIHDTVSQSLFGIVFTLDGCLKMLPDDPEAVETEIRRVLDVAEETRAEIRKSILDMWPSELTADRFVIDLQKYAVGICQADQLEINFDVTGDFSRLSSLARRTLYRISQEAIANIAHHAAASEAHVCVEVNDDQATLSVRDNGRGFEPDTAFQREYGREHFGLWGIRERTQSLGGSCEINSQPGAGASIIVDIPI